MTGQKSQDEGCPRRIGNSPRGVAGGFDLQQHQPRMIEKDPAGCGELDAPSPALQQWANFQFEVDEFAGSTTAAQYEAAARPHG